MSFAYLIKPLSYVLVIAMGYLLKRTGFFGKEDHRLISRIMINITLPCAIIQAFDGFERGGSMMLIVLLGFLCAFIPMLVMYLSTFGVEKRLRVYRMLNVGGYNIGCFTIPLVESFFGSAGVVAACLFDMGNAVMMTGGSYAMTSTLLKTGGEHRESAKDILLKFLRSAPFDVYLAMFALIALNISVPQIVFDLTRPAAQANAFIAMLMIGMMFEPMGQRSLLREAIREICWRYALITVFAAGIWFLTPFDVTLRKTLIMTAYGPLSSLAPVYTDRCRGDAALASFTNSLSIAVSLVIILALGTVFML